MTIARHYVMVATETQAENLKTALVDLAARVKSITGCEGVALFQDTRIATRFTFIEYWTSIDAHREGGQALGKEALTPVLATLAMPPEGAYLEKIAL